MITIWNFKWTFLLKANHFYQKPACDWLESDQESDRDWEVERMKLNLIVTSNVLCRHFSFRSLSGKRCSHSLEIFHHLPSGWFMLTLQKQILCWMAFSIFFFLALIRRIASITFMFLYLFSDRKVTRISNQMNFKSLTKKRTDEIVTTRWAKATVNSFNLFLEVNISMTSLYWSRIYFLHTTAQYYHLDFCSGWSFGRALFHQSPPSNWHCHWRRCRCLAWKAENPWQAFRKHFICVIYFCFYPHFPLKKADVAEAHFNCAARCCFSSHYLFEKYFCVSCFRNIQFLLISFVRLFPVFGKQLNNFSIGSFNVGKSFWLGCCFSSPFPFSPSLFCWTDFS